MPKYDSLLEETGVSKVELITDVLHESDTFAVANFSGVNHSGNSWFAFNTINAFTIAPTFDLDELSAQFLAMQEAISIAGLNRVGRKLKASSTDALEAREMADNIHLRPPKAYYDETVGTLTVRGALIRSTPYGRLPSRPQVGEKELELTQRTIVRLHPSPAHISYGGEGVRIPYTEPQELHSAI